MAYNYFPISYQPYYQPIQQTPQVSNYQNNQSGILWVGNEQEAISYPVAPNNAVALWDSSKPSVYIKQADASGKPTVKIYDLQERTQSVSAGVEKQECNYIEYAAKSDVDTLARDFEAFKSEIKALKREITKARRKEVVEDDDE